MKALYDEISFKTSKLVTQRYSTSFSMGIRLFKKPIRMPIYSIYGFVRLGDEIVDTFHEYDKKELFERFKKDVYLALDERISLNPVLNSFQQTVHKYGIRREHIDLFLRSMEMDLEEREYDRQGFETYILGSAEVVGLMCLHIFCNGDDELYKRLKPYAMSLGSAYQKINFLRDLSDDYQSLGRTYFPNLSMDYFNENTKQCLIEDIKKDFQHAYQGIKLLPRNARFGVFLSYVYYYSLLRKIMHASATKLMNERIRLPNSQKYAMLFTSAIRYKLTM